VGIPWGSYPGFPFFGRNPATWLPPTKLILGGQAGGVGDFYDTLEEGLFFFLTLLEDFRRIGGNFSPTYPARLPTQNELGKFELFCGFFAQKILILKP